MFAENVLTLREQLVVILECSTQGGSISGSKMYLKFQQKYMQLLLPARKLTNDVNVFHLATVERGYTSVITNL